MRSGGWGSGQARQVSASVAGLLTTRGKKVDVSRSLPSTLPGQFSVGGSAAATGSVSAGTSSGVTDRVGTPFYRRDWPQPGDPVGVKVTDGVNSHQVFTGNVDGTDSSFGSPDVSVKLVDHTDRLSTQVSHNAVFRTMPPLSTTGDERPRMTGLTTAHVTTMLAREAGYYMTPPRQGYIIISAPLTGSTWPERGELWESGRSTDIGQYHRYQPYFSHPDGSGTVYASDVWATYNPPSYGSPHSGSITTDRDLHLTLGAGPSQASTSYASLRWSTSYEFRVAVTSSRTITVQHRNAGASSAWTTLHQANPAGWRYVQVSLDKRTDDTLHLRVATDTLSLIHI